MKKQKPMKNLQFVLIAESTRTDCYWCAKLLRECKACHGSGLYHAHECYPCNGKGKVCPDHGPEWEF